MKSFRTILAGSIPHIYFKPIAVLSFFLFIIIQGYAQFVEPLICQRPEGIISNSPLRSGETLYIVAQGGDSYEWSGPNGFNSNSATIEIPNISPADTGIYSVTVTSPYFDTLAVYSTYVTLTPLVPICLGATNYDVCINAFLDLYANTYSPTYTYFWSTTIPNISIPSVYNPGSIQIPDGTLPGTYSVNLTIYSGSNIVCSDNILINIYDCCLPKSNVYPVNIIHNESTTNPSLIFTDNTVVLGTLVVPANFSLPSNVTEVTLLPSSSILVYNETFSATNVDFHGCENLWRSIVINESASVQFIECTFRDAMWAISNASTNQSNSPTISMTGCHLRDNYISINVFNCSQVFDLSDNDFYTQDYLLPALVSPVYAGIHIDNCIGSTLSGNGMNKFHDMFMGIYTVNSALTIESDATIFYNFNPQNQPGLAINAYNHNSSQPLTLTKYGNTSAVDFYNCYIGIQLTNCACDIRNNRFSRVSFGINSNDALHRSLTMINNNIGCSYAGIYVNLSLGSLYSLDISENTISLFPTSTSQFRYGIYIGNVYGYYPDDQANINNNEVLVGMGGKNGIKLNNCRGIRVAENSVLLNDCSGNLSGINITSGGDNLVLCNSIVGSDPNCQNSSVTPNGISVVSSPDGHYGFNETDQTYIGVLFDQYCSNTNIRNHKCYDHSYGIYYTQWGITGDQYHKGNSWLGTYPMFALYDVNQLVPGGTYFIGVNGYQPPSYSPIIMVSNTGLWEATGVSPCSGGGGGGSSASAQFFNGFTSLDSSVVTDQLTFSSFVYASKWNAQRVLFNKIVSDSVKMLSNALMYSFADSLKNESSGLFQILENTISSSSLIASSDTSLINDLLDSIKTVYQLIASIDATIVDDTLALPSGMLKKSRSNLVAQLSGIEDSLMNIIGNHHSKFLSLVPQFISKNNQLPDTGVYENNQKVLNDIYLNSVLPGHKLTTNQKYVILDIAEQCPISGGKAVYLARTLVASFKDTTYNDVGKCIQVGNSKDQAVQTDATGGFTFYPNPASNNITIENVEIQEGNALISIFDLSGKLVNSLNLQLNQKTTDIDVAALHNGIYTISVQHKGKLYNLGNLVINK